MFIKENLRHLITCWGTWLGIGTLSGCWISHFGVFKEHIYAIVNDPVVSRQQILCLLLSALKHVNKVLDLIFYKKGKYVVSKTWSQIQLFNIIAH